MSDDLEDEIKRLRAEVARLQAELQMERGWREELQKLTIDQQVEIEKLKGLQ